jgi:hypothetical protein
MRTTLDLNDQLLARAKARAVEEHTTLTRLVEQGLILRLRDPESVASIESLELPPPIRGTGRLRPEVTNAASYAALLDLMDEDVPLDSRR